MMSTSKSHDNSCTTPVYFFNENVPGHCLTFIQGESDGYLLCGTEDGSVSVWDLRTLRLEVHEILRAGASQCISVNVCNDKLITQDKEGLIRCWVKSDVWKEVLSIRLQYCGFCKLSVNVDLGLIACPFKNCALQIYNLQFKLLSTFEPNGSENKFGYVMGSKFVKCHGRYFLLAAYENGNVVLWDLDSNKQTSVLNLYKSPLFALDFDDLKNQGICGTSSKKLSIFKVNESLSLQCIHIIKLKSAGLGSIKIHPIKEIFAVGCWDSMIRIFSWQSFKLLSVLSFHSQGVEDICFASKKCEVIDCDCVLFATSRDRKISLWNVSEL